MSKAIIIGAGAAGIFAAVALKKKGIESIIIEKGEDAGNSWRNMPEKLRLISPIKSHKIESVPLSEYFSDYRMTAVEFANYLRLVAERENLNIKYNSKVLSVKKSNSLFSLELDDGKCISSDYLVNATGYYSSPFLPKFSGADDTKIKQIHFADYKSPSKLGESINRILIVGKRLSAGQLISELDSAGKEVAISARGPVEYTPGPIIFNLFLRILTEFEKIILFLNPKKKMEVPMEAADGKELISSGKVALFPNIKELREREVIFENGQSESFDMIIYATGFNPSLKHLKDLGINTNLQLNNSFESTSVKNLFFLGLENQRNFRSRFIRGIKEDVLELSELLNSRGQHENT